MSDNQFIRCVGGPRWGGFTAIPLAALLCALLVTSCDSAATAVLLPTPTTTATAVPTTTPLPTPTLTPTAAAPWTPTPHPATHTPSPTATAVPPTATVTKVPQVRIVRQTLPNGVSCPFREVQVPEGAKLVGRSAVCRLPIVSYRIGQGETPLILVGGIHGGYEWNTILLAEKMHDYLLANPQFVPPSLSIYLIPNANPDGLYAVTESAGSFEPPQNFEETKLGRFNGRGVDLNRNWDCEWQSNAFWGSSPVSGGAAPFSEPETAALRDYFLEIDPAAVLFWHSAAAGVYPAGCGYIGPVSAVLANSYRAAAGYDFDERFDYYGISGDAGNWLTTLNIPSITVELSTHSDLDWEENLAGMEALLQQLAGEAAE